MGQQVLTLGLATGDDIDPILSPIYVSSVKAQGLKEPFKEGRRVVAGSYRIAPTSKPEIRSQQG